MIIKQFFSSLTVLYLKMFQYEKYIDGIEADKIIEQINDELRCLTSRYDDELGLSKMSLSDMIGHCVIKSSFNHTYSESFMRNQLTTDLSEIEFIGRKVFKTLYLYEDIS